MKRLLIWVGIFKKIIDWCIERVCISIMALLTILVIYQVVTRYLFDSPSAVSEVLSRYLFIWLVLIGAAYVFGLKEHMSITYVRDKFSPKVGVIVDLIVEWSISYFAYIVMWHGGYKASVRQMWQLDSALEIPIGIIYSALPISAVLILTYSFINQIKLINKYKEISEKG